jgi:hypothetical protein
VAGPAFWVLNSCRFVLTHHEHSVPFAADQKAGPSLPQVRSRYESRYVHTDSSVLSLNVGAGVINKSHESDMTRHRPKNVQQYRSAPAFWVLSWLRMRSTLTRPHGISASKLYRSSRVAGIVSAGFAAPPRRVSPVLYRTALPHVFASCRTVELKFHSH